MYKHPLFISWTLLLAVIAILHILALEFYLYWVYSWFDIMMHFLGGVFVGLSSLWFFFESGYVTVRSSIKNVIVTTAGSIILVGIGWEVFEVLAGIPVEEDFILDTAIDLLMDTAGASVAGMMFIKIFLTENKEEERSNIESV